MVAQSAGNPQGGMSPLNYADGGVNFNTDQLSKRLTPNIEVPELKPLRGSKFRRFFYGPKMERFLNTKINLPIKSPLKGIGQYFFSDEDQNQNFTVQTDFPTASSSQLATLDALVQMNPNNKDEIYSLGKRIITDNKSDATGENLANLMKSEKLMLDKEKAEDEKFDKEAKEANQKVMPPGFPEIDPITKEEKKQSNELIAKLTSEAEKDKNLKNIADQKVSESQEGQSQVNQEGQVDQDQQDTEVETAIDATTQAVQESINAIKEAANTNDKKTVENNLEGYIEEFKAAMPKYEGMTEEEKGFAIIEAGLNIAAGESTNAIMNIANGLKPVVAKLAKNKEAEKAFNTQINISAAKYGIERLNNDRQRNFNLEDEMRKYMRKEKTFFVSNSKGETIDGVFYKQGSPITLTNQQINDGAFEKLKGKVTSEGIMKQIFSDANDLFIATQKSELENIKNARVTPKESKTILDIAANGRTFTKCGS
jgi:hypothetical protein